MLFALGAAEADFFFVLLQFDSQGVRQKWHFVRDVIKLQIFGIFTTPMPTGRLQT